MKKNPRYQENSHDTPLSELGFNEILKLKPHPYIDTVYESIYLPQEFPFAENDNDYGNRMIHLMCELISPDKNIAIIGHKGVVTLAAVYLNQVRLGEAIGQFFRPVNGLYFGDIKASVAMVRFVGSGEPEVILAN